MTAPAPASRNRLAGWGSTFPQLPHGKSLRAVDVIFTGAPEVPPVTAYLRWLEPNDLLRFCDNVPGKIFKNELAAWK